MRTENYIVYVEDDEDDQQLMEEIMRKHNDVSLVTVSDGQELIDFLEDQRDGDMPCLVIMDNNTPRMSGIETVGHLKKDDHFSKLPLILLSTALSKTDEDFCRGNSISVFTKPSTYAEWETLSQSFLKYCNSL